MENEENVADETSFNMMNKSSNTTGEKKTLSLGLLEKLETLKNTYNSSKTTVDVNVSFLKVSNDDHISKFCAGFYNVCHDRPISEPYHNIGLNNYIKIIPHPENENSILKINFYDYNYLLSKKFKYLRNEAVVNSEKLVLVLNVYDKRGIENFKSINEEIKTALSKKKEITNVTTICILLKITSNFLLKINEKKVLENLKKDLINLGIKNIIELEEENIKDINSLIEEIIFSK